MATNPSAAAAGGGLTQQATTGAAGFALQNATPNILTWTAPGTPGDGNMHNVLVTAVQHPTLAETGGAVAVNWTGPDGTAGTAQSLYAGGAAAGAPKPASAQMLVQSGTVVTVAQTSALTAGTCTLWAVIAGQ